MADEVLTLAGTSALSDEEVVERVLAGDTALYEVVMRRYNTRLYRVARSILKNDGQAEDVIQDAYVRAFQFLGQFAGRAKFSTGSPVSRYMRHWLGPIRQNASRNGMT